MLVDSKVAEQALGDHCFVTLHMSFGKLDEYYNSH